MKQQAQVQIASKDQHQAMSPSAPVAKPIPDMQNSQMNYNKPMDGMNAELDEDLQLDDENFIQLPEDVIEQQMEQQRPDLIDNELLGNEGKHRSHHRQRVEEDEGCDPDNKDIECEPESKDVECDPADVQCDPDKKDVQLKERSRMAHKTRNKHKSHMQAENAEAEREWMKEMEAFRAI